MGRVKTAAAKKYIEKNASSDDENLSDLKRSARPKRGSTANNSHASPRQAAGRPNRSTRQSVIVEKQNGRNGVSNNKPTESSSVSSSEDEAPVATRKRKSSIENASPKKQKPSTSASSSKSKPTDKKADTSKSSKKKKKEEERYEVSAHQCFQFDTID